MYKRGYIAGVFDLFHVGHLNVIKNARSICEYLVVGVLEDKLVIRFKKSPPVIPQGERLEIINSLKYVDEAVLVDSGNIEKMDAWNQIKFDCLFSGDDHAHNPSWIRDKKLLNKVGADICFFPYTQSTSSTKIKRILNQEDKESEGIFVYGAGKYGLKALEYYGYGGVVGFIDRDESKIGTLIYGKPVLDINKIGGQLTKDHKIVIALKDDKEAVKRKLMEFTDAKIEIFM